MTARSKPRSKSPTHGNDRSKLREKMAKAISGLRVWESVEVEIEHEEGMHQGRVRSRMPGRFHYGDSDRSGSGARRAQTPAAYAAREEARIVGVIVKMEVMPKGGGEGLVLRITRVG